MGFAGDEHRGTAQRQGIDFGHLLAAMNLVYRGMPITGSWGGDCMQLAQVYAGQASDADGYASLMQQTFAIEDDGSASKFATRTCALTWTPLWQGPS